MNRSSRATMCVFIVANVCVLVVTFWPQYGHLIGVGFLPKATATVGAAMTNFWFSIKKDTQSNDLKIKTSFYLIKNN